MQVNKRDINNYIYNYAIEEYLYSHGVDYTDCGDNYRLSECPDCGKRNGKCFVHKEKKFYHCYSCDGSSNLFGLMSSIESIPRSEIFIREIKNIDKDGDYDKKIDVGRLHVFNDLNVYDIDFNVDSGFSFEVIELPSDYVNVVLSDGSIQSLYAKKRGLSEHDIEKFGIVYSLREKRLVFPFIMYKNIVGWQGRDITETNNVKTMTQPFNFPKNRYLYNFDMVDDEVTYMTIVEGPIDCIKSSRFNSVALLGSTLSIHQLNLLLTKKKLTTIFMAIDPEEDYKKGEIYKKISPFFKVYDIRNLPYGVDDIGDCTYEQVIESLSKSDLYDSLSLDVL